MRLHQRLITFDVRTRYGANARVLLDCGSTTNFISESFVQSHKVNVVKIDTAQVVRLADGTKQKANKLAINFHFVEQLGEREFCEDLLVFPLESYDIILGVPWLRRHNPVIDWVTNKLTFPRIDAFSQLLKNNHLYNSYIHNKNNNNNNKQKVSQEWYAVRRAEW